MTQHEAQALRKGQRVEVEYMGERHEVEVLEGALADRWGETALVKFSSGALWAPHYSKIIRIV